MASLKALCKKRILEEMIAHAVGPDKNYIVLVVDQKSLRVLSSCCGVYDILEDGVTLVELLEKRRQPLPELQALYFISSSEESLELLLQDFREGSRPHYKAAHVFFTSLPAHEQRIFHMDSPSDFVDLYLHKNATCLERYADQLYTLCASLGIIPEVRFQKNLRSLPQQLATLIHERLYHATFPQGRQRPHSSSSSSSTVLLIADRSVDLCTLLLHEYTYQALAYDILEIPTCSSCFPAAGTSSSSSSETTSSSKNKAAAAAAGRAAAAVGSLGSLQREDTFEYEVVNNAGGKEKKQLVLGEQDDLWLRFRHEHVQHVNENIQEDIRKFLQDNATAKMQRSTASQGATLQAIRALPQYQEMLAKYWAHVALSERCFDQLQTRNIMRIGLLEQSLACGVEKDGKEVSCSKLFTALSEHLSDRQLRAEDKVRLLLLYFLQIGGLTQSERTKILEMAQLSLASQECIQRFLELGLQEDDLEGSFSTAAKHIHRLSVDKETIKYFKKQARQAEYELSRFEPFLKRVMEKALQGELHGGNYPFLEERKQATPKQPVRKGSSTDEAIGRGSQWDWSSTWAAPSTASSPQNSEGSRERLIVFVIGGITHAEMRSAYAVSKELGADVFLGGSCILTPPMVLKLLKDAGSAATSREK